MERGLFSCLLSFLGLLFMSIFNINLAVLCAFGLIFTFGLICLDFFYPFSSIFINIVFLCSGDHYNGEETDGNRTFSEGEGDTSRATDPESAASPKKEKKKKSGLRTPSFLKKKKKDKKKEKAAA